MDELIDNFKNTSFMYSCKENYYKAISPGNPDAVQTEGYKSLVEIAETYFSIGLYEPIIQYLNEKRYHLQLWSAYIILRYGNVQNDLKYRCINILMDEIEDEQSALTMHEKEVLQDFINTKTMKP